MPMNVGNLHTKDLEYGRLQHPGVHGRAHGCGGSRHLMTSLRWSGSRGKPVCHTKRNPHMKGQEKVDHKGKGKGKFFNGACNSCGVWGRMTRDCSHGKGEDKAAQASVGAQWSPSASLVGAPLLRARVNMVTAERRAKNPLWRRAKHPKSD